jgi:hypothetical protein
MTDTEKAISLLQQCLDERPYAAVRVSQIMSCIQEAVELLKEQEPRVLTLDEADAAEVVWFEARNHIFIEPMLTRRKRLADEAEDWFQYGRDWRCWSTRPSDKQREEAPWDEITG